MKQSDTDYGMKNGHSPIAEKVICVDWDGTIAKWGPLYWGVLHEGCAEALRAFKKAGYTIVILTSRLSPTWLKSAGENANDHKEYIINICRENNIPFDDITCEKIPAELYVDDKAIEFKGNWKEIQERILGC